MPASVLTSQLIAAALLALILRQPGMPTLGAESHPGRRRASEAVRDDGGMSGQTRSVLGLVLVAGLAVAAFLVPARDWRTVVTLHLLAGSELDDLIGPDTAGDTPFLRAMEHATGVRLQVTFAGSLSGAETLTSQPGSYQLAWFASDSYLQVLSRGGEGVVLEKQPIARSSVVLGVKHSVAVRYGWDGRRVSWQDVAAKVATEDPVTRRGFSFAMTDPASSNSGLAALIGAATAAGGSPRLDARTIERAASTLSMLFRGVGLTASSSGWLTDQYVAATSDLDGMVNYESEIDGLNQRAAVVDKLDVIRPENGVVDVDYPLLLLRAGADQRAGYDRLATWLRQDWAQRWIVDHTGRDRGGEIPADRIVIPSDKESIDRLLTAYQDRLRRPSRTFYVLDKSGSMGEPENRGGTVRKIDKLKGVFIDLADGSSAAARFRRFRTGEHVTVLPFDRPLLDQFNTARPRFRPAEDREIAAGAAGEQARRQLTDYVGKLEPSGRTALFDALFEAYVLLRREAGTASGDDTEVYPSIVLLTDGMRDGGMSEAEFASRWRAIGSPKIRVFAVHFGPERVADRCGRPGEAELCKVAELTGGRVFDTSSAALLEVFREIRGYQ